MRVIDLKDIVEREPFRAFTIRLSNGAQYTFNSRRDLGAAKDYGMIFYFADSGGAARIDTENIAEILEAK